MMGDGTDRSEEQEAGAAGGPVPPLAERSANGQERPTSTERLDEDGLPLDRPATLDDVRGTSGSGRTIAIGCTVLVLALILAFWGLRAVLLG